MDFIDYIKVGNFVFQLLQVIIVVDDSGSIAISDVSKSSLLKSHWKQIWDLASRACASQANTRAACALLETILRLELIDNAEATDTIRLMLSGMDINGPSALCDTSLLLLARIFNKRLHTAAGLGQDSAKSACNWLRNLWAFGIYSPFTVHPYSF